ncbi:MAG: glycine cleavage system protein GcvH [Deltaproteobacteria bacterium]|nr:glycine cleavage system protein GcvH [Deltaproteobacteria bacterium]
MATKNYELPVDCRYAATDEWVRLDGAIARIGITDYAQSELSDIVFVEVPSVGSELVPGQTFGVVESVKAVSDLHAPIGGEVIQVNEDLEEHPEWVNEEPYERGWIIEVRVADPAGTDDLMTADDYRAHVEERAA